MSSRSTPSRPGAPLADEDGRSAPSRPVAPADEDARSAPSRPDAATDEDRRSTPSRPVVILTEEDTRQRRDIARHLEEAGFAVVEAGDSDQALAQLKARPDARGFVTDAHVPGSVDGYELARVVRERHPDLAVVLMSGHSDPSSGPVPDGGAFVAKPYLLEHLAPTLRRMMAG